MAFDIGTFRHALTYDGQRPNLFKVQIPNKGNIFKGTDLELFAKGTSIPGATIGTVIVPYFGREVKLAGNRTFPEWTITVINDENFSHRSQFENWMHMINHHSGNIRKSGTGTKSYVNTATVTQFSKAGVGAPTAKYEFVNLFPTDLSEITLDWGDNDTVEEYTVTFSYDFWNRLAGNLSGGSGVIAEDIITSGGAPSDFRLKNNITLLQEKGFGIPNIYSFNYKWDAVTTWIGVMAQELLDTGYSDAVGIDSEGFYNVNYSKLGFPMIGFK